MYVSPAKIRKKKNKPSRESKKVIFGAEKSRWTPEWSRQRPWVDMTTVFTVLR